MIFCSVAGCAAKRDGRSLMCGKHRRRLRLYGDVNITKNRKPGEGFYASGYLAFQENGRKKFEHIIIAESVIGKELPIGAVVHHANCMKSDNSKANLVICPDRSYHNLLHKRIDAYNATGNPNANKCRYCKKYDSNKNLTKLKNDDVYWHAECANEYNRKYRRNKKCYL